MLTALRQFTVGVDDLACPDGFPIVSVMCGCPFTFGGGGLYGLFSNVEDTIYGSV